MKALDLVEGEERELSDFQRRSHVSLSSFLDSQSFEFQQDLRGENETYIVVSFKARSRNYRVFIYEDEVGYFEGDSWKIWEKPDYDFDEHLFNAFMGDLQVSVDRVDKLSQC